MVGLATARRLAFWADRHPNDQPSIDLHPDGLSGPRHGNRSRNGSILKLEWDMQRDCMGEQHRLRRQHYGSPTMHGLAQPTELDWDRDVGRVADYWELHGIIRG